MGKLRFGRRKSSTSALDEVPTPTTPAVSSFRVIERPEKINLNGPPRGAPPVTRPFNSPLVNLKGRSVEELGVGLNRSVETAGTRQGWMLNGNRGSGGTTTSGSSGYYESSSASARHSSSSTLPSSVDAEREPEDDELFPWKTKTTPMYQNVSRNEKESPPPPPPPPSFTTRAARALSFGNKHNKTPSDLADVPLPPVPTKGDSRSESPKRERAMTTSSYASTAKPDVALNLSTPDFGSEFGSMFERPKSGERFNGPLPAVPPVAAFHRTVRRIYGFESCHANSQQESEPMFPPRRHSRDAFRASPELSKDGSGSPYAWDRNGSRERLMSYSPLGSPTLDAPPQPPPHRSNVPAAFLGQSKDGYSSLPERFSTPAQERLSQDSPLGYLAGHINEKDEEYESNQNQQDDNPWVKRVELHDASGSVSHKSSTSEFSKVQTRVPFGYPSQASAGASRAEAQTPYSSEEGDSFLGSESRNSTPRAAKLAIARQEDDSLFDSSPLGPPSRAIRPQHSRGESNTPKKMTTAQFERLQRRGDASADQSEEEDDEQRELDEYDDEDDSEKARQMSRQRQKQEANMSVYRQQMKKVTGGGPTDLPSSAPRPSIDRAPASAPAAPGGIHLGGIGGKPPADAVRGMQTDDDDDDVPLGILQAHGFPNSSRPPTRAGENDAAHQRRTSTAGSVAGAGAGQGSLPPFARRLPVDPYFGSSVVNQTNREALGMAGTPSAYGGVPPVPPMPQMVPQPPPAPQMGHPGGLVGVIAGEERAKAARRGSPNPATGTFGPAQMPLPVNMAQMGGVPGMPRAMSTGSLAHPQMYTPSGIAANPMMSMPMMPQMQLPQMMPNPQQDQMQQFMQMQMQVMQNMLNMQQVQMGQTPPAQQPQIQDYLGVPGHAKKPSAPSMASQAPSIRSQAGQAGNQGRAMTMMHPPTRWDLPQQGPRPNSVMPQTYSPSGLNITNGNGPEPGYTPSIAPSERSNIGMPSRYRPVTMTTDASGRTNSMSSTSKLQAYGNRNPSPEVPEPQPQPQSKPTIRAVDKPKGALKILAKSVPAEEDEDEGWAEMRKKREDRMKFRFGKKDKEISLDELVHNLN